MQYHVLTVARIAASRPRWESFWAGRPAQRYRLKILLCGNSQYSAEFQIQSSDPYTVYSLQKLIRFLFKIVINLNIIFALQETWQLKFLSLIFAVFWRVGSIFRATHTVHSLCINFAVIPLLDRECSGPCTHCSYYLQSTTVNHCIQWITVL